MKPWQVVGALAFIIWGVVLTALLDHEAEIQRLGIVEGRLEERVKALERGVYGKQRTDRSDGVDVVDAGSDGGRAVSTHN